MYTDIRMRGVVLWNLMMVHGRVCDSGLEHTAFAAWAKNPPTVEEFDDYIVDANVHRILKETAVRSTDGDLEEALRPSDVAEVRVGASEVDVRDDTDDGHIQLTHVGVLPVPGQDMPALIQGIQKATRGIRYEDDEDTDDDEGEDDGDDDAAAVDGDAEEFDDNAGPAAKTAEEEKIGEEGEKKKVFVLKRGDIPINDYAQLGKGLIGAFPDLFLLRRGVPRDKKLQPKHYRRLMVYGDNRFATCHPLVFHLASVRQRHAVNCGVAATVRNDPEKFAKFAASIGNETFQANLDAALADPMGRPAMDLVEEVLTFCRLSTVKVPWGEGERAAEITKGIAVHRTDGPATSFLSIAPDDVKDHLCIVLSRKFTSRDSFPATDCDEFKAAIKNLQGATADKRGDGTTLDMTEAKLQRDAANNPVAAALAYRFLINNIFDNVLCAAVSKKDVGLFSSPTGALGKTPHADGVDENNERGSFHTHVQLRGGITPMLLADVAYDKDLRATAVGAIDTTTAARLPVAVHGINEVVKVRTMK